MANPVGLRLRPTDEEILNDYLGPKNLKSNTSHVDRVISTVTICSFDPLELPPQSRIKLKDHVWYFFSPKENKYGKGERQIRTTKSGFWKITGKPKDIIRNRQKIGHKKVLMFYFGKTPNGSKSDWVMHEYHLFSPNQMMTYTFCKVKFKGNMSEIEQSRSLIPPMNNHGGLSTRTEGPPFKRLTGQELQNQPQRTNFPDVEELDWLFANIASDRFKSVLDDDEQSKIVTMDENRSNHIPQKALTGVFSGYSSDGSDSGSISQSATTTSIQNSSTCDSFGSSNHCIDLQESPNSTINLVLMTQEVSKTLDKKENLYDDVQETETGEYKMGQDVIKNKNAGFFYRIIQRFKKIQLCSSI
ncbi:NAC domain-containing protein 5 [Cardamine amara subsp. amara]|uniref:NAC domain-containing protein 5 n=1 Tax=Cardamine amara subsp. amara TaxID=228776 RepID=A0ABD1BSZ3_CARAN